MARKKAPPAQQALPPSRAAIYLRVSTDEQATSGFGLDVQRERCRAMATVKGWRVVAEYADEGISGTLPPEERPGLAALLDAIAAGEVDAVIVLAFDRLGRKTRIVLDLVERLAHAGVVLVSCKESLDTATPQGQFVLTMFAALAQLERDTIVERTTAGRDERGRRDGEKGGRLPFGYLRHENGPQVDPAAAAIVRTIFAHRAHGDSLRTIAASLQAQHIDGPQGGRWGPSSIKAILDNADIYQGGQRGDSPVNWPPILSPEPVQQPAPPLLNTPLEPDQNALGGEAERLVSTAHTQERVQTESKPSPNRHQTGTKNERVSVNQAPHQAGPEATPSAGQPDQSAPDLPNQDAPSAGQLPRLDTITLKGKPHLQLRDQNLTLCKRPAAGVQPSLHRPTPGSVCKRCLSKAESLGLLCTSCGQPLTIPSDTQGVCQHCYTEQHILKPIREGKL